MVPWHFLYFLPLPQGQGSFLPILWFLSIYFPTLTHRLLPSVVNSIVPCLSVRYISDSPTFSFNLATTSLSGWPKSLSAPTEITTALGLTTARNSGLVDVADP